jgi:hypothetical protein
VSEVLNVGLKVWLKQNIVLCLRHKDVELGVVYQLRDNLLMDGMIDNELYVIPINTIDFEFCFKINSLI